MPQKIRRGRAATIEQALAGLKHVIKADDRDAILQWTTVLNEATKHLAEVMMNRSRQKAALAGKNVDTVYGRARAQSPICLKSLSSSDGERQTVEFEHGKLPHGTTAARVVPRRCEEPRRVSEHACGGSCACNRPANVIIREGAQNSAMEDDEADRLDNGVGP